MHSQQGYCLDDHCPNTTGHKSGYCVMHRTMECPVCGKIHVINQAPHDRVLKYCYECKRKLKNKRK